MVDAGHSLERQYISPCITWRGAGSASEHGGHSTPSLALTGEAGVLGARHQAITAMREGVVRDHGRYSCGGDSLYVSLYISL